MNTMEYGKAFTYPQEDQNWIVKLLIVSFIPLVPIIGGFISLGYAIEITRRVIRGETPTLPEWSDFGDFLKKGFLAFVVALAYLLPLIILAVCASIPQVALSSADDGSGNLAAIGGLIGVCFGCLAALYGIVVGIALPAAFGKLAVTGELGAALRISEVVALVRTKPAVFLIIMLISSLVGSLLASIGSVLCFIGAFVGAGYAQLVAAHLWGQAYRVASAEAGRA